MKKYLKNVNMSLFVISVAVFAIGLKGMADIHDDAGQYVECEGELGSDARRKCDMQQAGVWLTLLAGAAGLLGSVGIKPFAMLAKQF